MALTAKVSSQELSAIVNQRYVGLYAEGLLIDAAGQTYTPGSTSDTNFLSNEVVLGTGGYERSIFKWNPADLSAYADEGISLNTKATVFAHDGTANAINFTHCALIWGSNNLESVIITNGNNLATVTVAGSYSDLPTFSSGGNGATLDFDVDSTGNLSNVAVNRPGTGYQQGDAIQVSEATLLTAGVLQSGQTGNFTFQADGVSTNAEGGRIIAVAKTTAPVVLDGGNEAAFFWDLKLFGFNS